MSDLVGNPEDRFSRVDAHLLIRAVAGQRSLPDLCCFATKSIKSMTKDIDHNVTQVGRDGTA